MRKLVVLLMVAALMSGICVAAFAAPTATQDVVVFWNIGEWIHLHIPAAEHNIDLGTIDGVLPGYPHFLYRIDLSATVRTNIADGFTLTVSAASTGAMPADLLRFYIMGGDLSWIHMGVTRTILSRYTAGTFTVTNLGYRYRVTTADAPGAYAVTVTFTATAR